MVDGGTNPAYTRRVRTTLTSDYANDRLRSDHRNPHTKVHRPEIGGVVAFVGGRHDGRAWPERHGPRKSSSRRYG